MIRIAGVNKESIVDGEGIRYVVYVQGCGHKCKGCHNPKTWSKEGGRLVSEEELWGSIEERGGLLKGLTISGGEPFDQAYEVSSFIKEKVRVERPEWDIWVYTGYRFEELIEKAREEIGVRRLIMEADVLVDGRYEESVRDMSLRFRGSRNQRIIDVKRSVEEGCIVKLEKY